MTLKSSCSRAASPLLAVVTAESGTTAPGRRVEEGNVEGWRTKGGGKDVEREAERVGNRKRGRESREREREGGHGY